jgi:hypothetical protein
LNDPSNIVPAGEGGHWLLGEGRGISASNRGDMGRFDEDADEGEGDVRAGTFLLAWLGDMVEARVVLGDIMVSLLMDELRLRSILYLHIITYQKEV